MSCWNSLTQGQSEERIYLKCESLLKIRAGLIGVLSANQAVVVRRRYFGSNMLIQKS